MTRALSLVLAVLVAACAGERPDAPGPEARPETGTPPVAEAAAEAPPSCESRREQAARAIEAAPLTRACQWSVDCVLVPVETRCGALGALPLAAAGVVEARAAVARVDAEVCAPFESAGCQPVASPAGPAQVGCVDGACAPVAASAAPERAAVPPQNEAGLATPPPRPPAGDAEERARRLFDAIVADDPLRAMDFFFPREAFLVLKGIADPGGYYDRLLARYVADIHALHAGTADLDRAEYVRLEIARRGGWVTAGEEANRLPYWASRHSSIVYRVGDQERRLEVRVLITWGERWYITHLSEFH